MIAKTFGDMETKNKVEKLIADMQAMLAVLREKNADGHGSQREFNITMSQRVLSDLLGTLAPQAFQKPYVKR